MKPIVNSVGHIWNTVISFGVNENLSPLEIRQVKTVNGVGLLGLITLTLLFIGNLFLANNSGIIYDLAGIFLVIIPTWMLNFRKRYREARTLTYFLGVILMTSIAVQHAITKTARYPEIVLIALSPASILFFDGALKKMSFAFCVVCYLLVFSVRGYNFPGDKMHYIILNGELILMSFVFSYTLSGVYKSTFIETQKVILRKNDEITYQSMELAEINKLKDRLISVISHDLRTPLNSLLGLLKLAENETLTKEEFNQHINQLNIRTLEVRDMLESLLCWSKIQIKKAVITEDFFFLSEVVNDILRIYESNLLDKRISLVEELPIDIRVYGNRESISIILRNFIANAIKFSYPDSEVYIHAIEERNCIKISVRDQGIGMSAEDVSLIFTDKKKSTFGTLQEPGTGLGLYLCNDIIQNIQGSIQVISELKTGSEFVLSLPKITSNGS